MNERYTFSIFRGATKIVVPFITLLFFCTVQRSAAQYFPDYVYQGIDSALSAVFMTRSDLTMRWDAAAKDPLRTDDQHLLHTVKYLFENPLYCFDLADSIDAVSGKGMDEPTLMFRYFQKLLELREGFLDTTSPLVTDREIQLLGRFDLGALDYTSALVLRRFVSLAIATEVKLLNYKSSLSQEQLDRLVELSDSLILESEDDAQTGLIEMRQQERYALERAKQYFNKDAAALDHTMILNPGVILYTLALDYARTIVSEVPTYRDSIKTSVWETPVGLIAIGGPGDDIYTGNFFCIVDIGGNDVYRAAPLTKHEAAERGVSLIIDFDGNDTYIGEDYAFGGTLFGASTLIDLNGDDNYSARNFSLGCGYYGIGVLHDEHGSDRYSGGTCVEGAGLFGIGLLVDSSGNDTYMAHLASQGFGFTRGIGGIIEGGGNDSYISSSPYQDYLRYDDHFESFCQGASLGYRPVAGGGFGYIADRAGNDNYVADIFGQGVAYWYGFGSIVDTKGNDSYNSYQYSQGSGVHLAFGVLVDENGDDNYVSHGVSQGCGHDFSFGGLYDVRGNDNYVVESLSLGGGNANAISLFVDGGGEDGYLARVDNTLGYSDLRRWYGMIGIFLDLDGYDFYGTIRGANDTLWTGSFYGAGLDAEMRPLEEKEKDNAEEEKSPGEIERELADDFPTLFIQASAAPQKYQYLVEPARKKLEEMADSSLPFLLAQLNSEHPRELLALRIMLPRIGNRLTPMLIDTILTGDSTRRSMAIHILGLLEDSSAAEIIGRILMDKDNWKMRAEAAQALLEMDGTSAKPYLKQALQDTVDLVRARAARALARVADETELQQLLPMLNDPSQIVRYQIQIGLQRRGVDSIADFLVNSLLSRRQGYTYDLLYPLAKELTGAEHRSKLLNVMLSDRSPKVRRDAVRLAIEWGDENLMSQAARLKSSEKNSMVLYEIYRIQEARAEKKLSDEARRPGG